MSAAGDINKWLQAAKRVAKDAKRLRDKNAKDAGTERRDNKPRKQPRGSHIPTPERSRKDIMDELT